MKVNLFCIFFFIAGICAFANHPAPSDTLITVDNDTIVCKRIQIEESSVSYVKAGQSVEFSLDKKFIKYVSTPKQAEKNSTIVTVGGDVIACNIVEENDMVVKYRELGKSAEYVLDKSQIATLVRPDGNVESYAGGEFQTGRHEKETSPVPEKIPAGTECRITTTKGEVIDCKIEDDNGSRIKYRKQGGSIVFILPKDEMESVELSKDAGYAKQDRAKAKNANEIEDYDRMENHDIKTLSVVNNMAESGMVTYKDDSGRLFLGDKEISKEQYMDMCYSIDGTLWEQYLKGTEKRKAGNVLLCVGSGCAIIGGILCIAASSLTIAGMVNYGSYYNYYAYDSRSALYISGGVFTGVGCGLVIAGIPVRLKGKNLREKSVNAYNSQLESHTVASLDFGVSDAGVGLALRF